MEDDASAGTSGDTVWKEIAIDVQSKTGWRRENLVKYLCYCYCCMRIAKGSAANKKILSALAADDEITRHQTPISSSFSSWL